MASEQIRARQNMGPKGGPMMKQPTFNWDNEDKCNELKNFRLEVYNIFKSYSIPDIEKTALIKSWLGTKGLQLLEVPTQAEEKCEMSKGLFKTLNDKFKLQYNEIIKSLQFCKLCRQANKSAKEWMVKLRIAATECNYKEIDRQLREQFIHGLNDSAMSTEIIKEHTKIEENSNITSEQVLAWARRGEAQRHNQPS